jgi:hypothetical protein
MHAQLEVQVHHPDPAALDATVLKIGAGNKE